MTDHQPPPAVEAIGRLEAKARDLAAEGARRYSETAHPIEGRLANANAKRCARDAEDLRLVLESLRHSVEREAGLREALEAFVAYDAHNDGDGVGMMLAYDTAITKARAALDRRMGDA